jgi:hypothetical protein
VKKPYFFFDSDIVWLRPVENLTPPGGGNAFSTESWSWYYGVCHDEKWITEQTPRRVNSGFYHLAQEFPFQRMEDMLEKSSFALLVMTAEDETSEGLMRARQNVVHEAGLFQGRLGFSRALMLLEKHLDLFSNVDGIQYLEYSKGNIKETFGDVLATLKLEFPQ